MATPQLYYPTDLIRNYAYSPAPTPTDSAHQSDTSRTALCASGRQQRQSVSLHQALCLSGDLGPVWLQSKRRSSHHQPEDDPCDNAQIRVMDSDSESETESTIDEESVSCCTEARLNCDYFTSVLREQAEELKSNVQKSKFLKNPTACCTVEKVKRIFPILQWAPKYRVGDLQGDLIAGFTVGMTLIPQAIAYAKIAQLSPEYGLYSSFIGCFIYVLFGTSKDISVGPTAIVSLVTALYANTLVPGDPTCAVLLGLFSGIVQILMYLIGLGVLIDFISFPVMKAFTVACSITIGLTQVKKWWGEHDVPSDFLPQLYWTIAKIPEARLYDFLLGCVCIFFIVLLKKLKEIKWKRKLRQLPCHLKIVKKGIWFIGTARNIIVLIGATAFAYFLYQKELMPFHLIGHIHPGIPPFQVPAFSIVDTQRNVTYTFGDIMSSIGIGIVVLPILGLLEAMSIAKVCARKFNYRVDANQELLPYGISNILGSFVMGYAVAGSFSRFVTTLLKTAVNAGSGVRTPAGGIVTGVLVLMSLQFFTPVFFYIPEAALACVIIMAVIDPITFHKVWVIWKTRKIDLIPWMATFWLSFIFNIEVGILVGAIISLLLLLYPVARPTIEIHEPDPGYEGDKPKLIVVTVNNGLMYPAVAYIREKILKICSEQGNIGKCVVLDFAHVSAIDTTTIQGVRELLADLNSKGIRVFVCSLQKAVADVFARAQPNFFNQAATIDEAVDILVGEHSSKSEPGPLLRNSSVPALFQYLSQITANYPEGNQPSVEPADERNSPDYYRFTEV